MDENNKLDWRKYVIISTIVILVLIIMLGFVVYADDEQREIDPTARVIQPTDKIIVNESMKISISGVVYDVTYVKTPEKPPIIKCICDKTTGCTVAECLP